MPHADVHPQRLKTLKEFRTMSVSPYPIQVLRAGSWVTLQTTDLLPGDVVSIVRQATETSVPADILLIRGTCIVNEAMLSGESTPLLKESIELLEGSDRLDVDGTHRNAVLFSGTKVLQAVPTSAGASTSDDSVVKSGKGAKGGSGATPDGGCLGVILRTGFGTTQGQLVRTMIFSTERVSANNFESFLFIGFLLIFAIAASWYVWVKGKPAFLLYRMDESDWLLSLGVERGLKKSKLLLDCVLIVTSVVPPELPMELSLAVNASLVALSKYGELPLHHHVHIGVLLTLLVPSHLLYGTVPDPVRRPR
jgi:cation-transporting ATPase 13A1